MNKNQESKKSTGLTVSDTKIADISIVSEIEKANIDMQIATAKKFPRIVKQCTNRAIEIVTGHPGIAQKCGYTIDYFKDEKTGKKKIVKGKSVHLARILVQCYGNLKTGSQVLGADAKSVTGEGVCYDLENNVYSHIRISRPIIKTDGTRYNEFMINVTGQVAAAIAKRNAIFEVIPAIVSDLVYKKAMDYLTDQIKDKATFIKIRDDTFKELNTKFGISADEMLKYMGLQEQKDITQDNIIDLIDNLNALETGDLDPEYVKGNGPVQDIEDVNQAAKQAQDEFDKSKDKIVGEQTKLELDAEASKDSNVQ